jgi:DNA (cytosine-5)-methyltransferase 1
MSKFKYVSLFAGIGGFDLALNRLGGECVLASEIDKFASQAYTAIYGGEHLHGDVTKVDEKEVPDHDVLAFGFPCQAFSVAGKRGGFEDARGTLFFEAARIAAEKKPKMILAENVKGLVSHDKGKTLDTIVKTLNDIGYRVDFEIVNSKYFGVPQNRERIFIVGIREDLVANEPWNNTKGSTIIPKGKRRLSEYPDVKTFNFDWPAQEEVTTRLVDVLETKVDERYYLSEEKTDQLVAKLEEKDKEDAPNVVHNIYGGFKESKPRVFKEESPTIRTSAGGGHLPSVLEEVGGLPIREATKKGYAVAQEGDAVNVRFPNSKTRRGRIGKQIANTIEATPGNQGVVEQFSEGGGVSCCLDANYSKGTAPGDVGKGRRTHIIEPTPKYRIRKLTPLETFRLQGFSDDVHQAIVDAGISDSQRFKMAGNAVTVNVIEALGERLLNYL